MDTEILKIVGSLIALALASGFVYVLVRTPKVGQGKNMHLLEPPGGSKNDV